MQVAVLHGTLSESEQDHYIRQVTQIIPVSIIGKIILDVQDEHVDVNYTLHRFRDFRKMGGYCIGEPADWSYAGIFMSVTWKNSNYTPYCRDDIMRSYFRAEQLRAE